MSETAKAFDDIRPRGTVTVECDNCEWTFWVDPLHRMLEPGARKVCPSCTSAATGEQPRKVETP